MSRLADQIAELKAVFSESIQTKKSGAKGGVQNLEDLVRKNNDFRRVIYTGDGSQVVAMKLNPGEDIGSEVHPDVEQTLTVLEGTGKVEYGNSSKPLHPGDMIVVPKKTRHNLTNTGDKPLKLFTIYVPPNHIDGRVHQTKADAEADKEDEKFEYKPKA